MWSDQHFRVHPADLTYSHENGNHLMLYSGLKHVNVIFKVSSDSGSREGSWKYRCLNILMCGRPLLACVCASDGDQTRSVWPAASDSLLNGLSESHGYLSAGWRRKHNPEEEGRSYQSVHAGLRERSAGRGRRAAFEHRTLSTLLTVISFCVSIRLLCLFFALHSDQPLHCGVQNCTTMSALAFLQ